MSASKENLHGLTKKDYQGAKSTLCTGCGHDSITGNIVSALFLANINPYDVAKMSGIGCSAKTTNYFLNSSHGFNSIHGRMGPMSVGVKVANQKLLTLGISGDGDTASIGLGGFAHLVRRNLPMTYIIENNGVYGLTKGQFSATADKGSTKKNGDVNPFEEEHDVTDKEAAMIKLLRARSAGEILTGIVYIDPDQENLMDQLQLTDKPLALLNEQETRPHPEVLQNIMKGFK
jgi:pyruvate/2-oxoacid:ferredoxin oxidoreductase beta subunit